MSSDDELVSRTERIVRALLERARIADGALGASWEYGAISATVFMDAVELISELERANESLRNDKFDMNGQLKSLDALATDQHKQITEVRNELQRERDHSSALNEWVNVGAKVIENQRQHLDKQEKLIQALYLELGSENYQNE